MTRSQLYKDWGQEDGRVFLAGGTRNAEKSQARKESLKGRNVTWGRGKPWWGDAGRRTWDRCGEDAFRSHEKLLTCLVTEIMTRYELLLKSLAAR